MLYGSTPENVIKLHCAAYRPYTGIRDSVARMFTVIKGVESIAGGYLSFKVMFTPFGSTSQINNNKRKGSIRFIYVLPQKHLRGGDPCNILRHMLVTNNAYTHVNHVVYMVLLYVCVLRGLKAIQTFPLHIKKKINVVYPTGYIKNEHT